MTNDDANTVTSQERAASIESATGADAASDELTQWVRVAVDAADDKLGQRTEAFFVGEVMGITDWFVVTSGANSRQVKAIVDHVEEVIARAGGPRPVRVEGLDGLTWVLVDYGFFVLHVFDDETRDFYELERLWSDVPRLVREPAAP